MRASILLLAATVTLCLSATAGACTGDVWVDSRVNEINDYGRYHQEPFVNEMVTYYSAPRPFVIELLGSRHWSPGDVYYACAFAHSIGRPCSEVAERYEQNRSGGWGYVMGSYNVGYASTQFASFRGSFVNTYGRWGHPIVIERNEHVRWTRGATIRIDERGHQPRGHAYGYWEHHGHDNGQHGHDHQDHGHEHDHEHEHGGDGDGHHGHDKKHEHK